MIAIRHQPPEPAGEPADLQPGQLVRHRRYGYRGVIVERDAQCQADEAWYCNNQTQPARDQPWYHVLVHESNACTYAAAENLVSDTSQLPIAPPLVARFFSAWQAGSYVRNSATLSDDGDSDRCQIQLACKTGILALQRRRNF